MGPGGSEGAGPAGRADPNGLLTMRIDLPQTRYEEIPAQTRFREQLVDRLDALPGVRAAMVSEVPLSGDSLSHNFAIEGNGLSQKLASDLPRGDTTDLSVDLKPGTYTIYCPVDGHRGKGMQRTLTVQ